ncbi:MAG: hypothetical protein KKA90_01740 [Nanoarchaeota archaeon]|nr:hypothetical protein [Nanoarchaeota archaeon]
MGAASKVAKLSVPFFPNPTFVRAVNASDTFDTVYYRDAQGTLLARRDPGNATFFSHPDHLGSTSLVTDESGDVVEETAYAPFGLPLYGADSKYLYTGKELDRGTGLSS